jgi:Ca-activated chloride channel family protein
VVVDFRSGVELDHVESPSHEMKQLQTARSLRLEPVTGNLGTDRDFLLVWRPRRSALPEIATFVETHGNERFALVMLVPPGDSSPLGTGLPTETLFVVDVSGSMQGPSIAQARQALQRALQCLRPNDRFNLLRFNSDSAVFAEGFRAADAATLDRARAWVAGLQANGGTAIYPALDRALRLAGEGSTGYASRVIFLTDGAVANEQEVLRAIAERIGSTRLHTIGIGAAPNAWLMRKMAWHGRGLSEFIATPQHTDNRIDAFFDRLERPLWTDLEVTWEGVTAEAVTTARLADMHAGEPLVLLAKLDGTAPGRLTVGGWSVDGWTERTADLQADGPEHSGIARTWARARIEALMDSIHEGADAQLVRDRVLALGLGFQLVTAYTSLVAVESYVGELTDGIAELASLPQTGTNEPLKRLLAVMFAAAGLLGLAGLRRGT